MKISDVEVRIRGEKILVEIDGRDAEKLWYKTKLLSPLTYSATSEHLTELLEFFLALYACDRLVKRPLRSWGRAFKIRFPVADVGRWRAAAGLIEKLIWQSMGDEVTLMPTERDLDEVHADRRATHLVLEYEQPTTIVMLSEGLDSLCGAFEAARQRNEHVAFTSIVTNYRKRPRLASIAAGLNRNIESPERLHFHSAQWHLEDAPRGQERTQRSRTMLAIATGLTVATAYGSPRVVISENGMGILNLASPALQSKHEASQVLHPSNLRPWLELSRLLLGGVAIEYPNRFRTKAQMCAALPEIAHELIKETSSCDAPQRADAQQDCGVCGSCVYRRLSLAQSGLSSFDTNYSSRPQKCFPYDPSDVLAYQAAEFKRCLAASEHFGRQWDALTEVFPTLQASIVGYDSTERAHEVRETVMLISRHVNEVLHPTILAHAV